MVFLVNIPQYLQVQLVTNLPISVKSGNELMLLTFCFGINLFQIHWGPLRGTSHSRLSASLLQWWPCTMRETFHLTCKYSYRTDHAILPCIVSGLVTFHSVWFEAFDCFPTTSWLAKMSKFIWGKTNVYSTFFTVVNVIILTYSFNFLVGWKNKILLVSFDDDCSFRKNVYRCMNIS